MLVIISDLHFVDETSGKHNIRKEEVDMVFNDIASTPIEPTEVKILFLGDIFDMNRSTYWISVPEAERPWGWDEKKIELHANSILDRILEKNSEVFEILRGSLKERYFKNVKEEPERIYVPGNHDRLCNSFPSLRKKVREALGIKIEDDPFLPFYDDRDFENKYGIFARHGHEFDPWNFDGILKVPIGDLITTEIASRIPLHALAQAEDLNISEPERERIKRNLEEIDNVRPQMAIFDWLYYQVKRIPEVRECVKRALEETIDNFEDLGYVKEWKKRHKGKRIKLEAFLTAARLFGFSEKVFRLLSAFLSRFSQESFGNPESLLEEEAREFLLKEEDIDFYVMGHTHNPKQVPIRLKKDGSSQIYLNVGTWRKRYVKGWKGDFIQMKGITYGVFYSREERKDFRFEIWTGSVA